MASGNVFATSFRVSVSALENCNRASFTMGMCCGSGAGAIIAERAENPLVYFEQDTGRQYAVSTSLRYRQWLLLGSPGDTGLVVCDMDRSKRS